MNTTRFEAWSAALSLVLLGSMTGCASSPGPVPGDWQPLIAGCEGVKPLLPQPALPSTAHFQVSAQLRDGRVVAKTVRVLKGIEDRRALRGAMLTIDSALNRATCPGALTLSAEALVGPQQAGFLHVQLGR